MNLTAFAVAATLVVANQGAGTISFVDTNTMKVTKTVEAGMGPHESAASPDGKRAAVTLYGRQQPNKEVLIVDAKTQSVVKRFDLAPSERAHGVTWRRGGIYITLERESAVARIDPDSARSPGARRRKGRSATCWPCRATRRSSTPAT